MLCGMIGLLDLLVKQRRETEVLGIYVVESIVIGGFDLAGKRRNAKSSAMLTHDALEAIARKDEMLDQIDADCTEMTAYNVGYVKITRRRHGKSIGMIMR